MSPVSPAAPTLQARMIALLERLAPTEGYTQSLLDGVTLMRANRPVEYTPALYEPSVVIVLQGRKRGLYGGNIHVYDARHYLVLSVPLPFSVETEASEQEPMLGLVIRIDPDMTAKLAMELDSLHPHAIAKPATLYATRLSSSLEGATARLLEALNSPSDARLLGPVILREILYWVLTDEQGGNLRAALLPHSHFGRIAGVLRRIHAEYNRSLDVATLAEEANMSLPTFHVHFKSVTLTSPLQYLKAIRLHHARLLMIRNGITSVIAAEQVGYQSPSQFSREFKRLFGRSPVQEVHQLKKLLMLSPPVVAGGKHLASLPH